jgi:hypothetical protein
MKIWVTPGIITQLIFWQMHRKVQSLFFRDANEYVAESTIMLQHRYHSHYSSLLLFASIFLFPSFFPVSVSSSDRGGENDLIFT